MFIVDTMEKTATLLLKNGSQYHGYAFSSKKPVQGELVFNTGMVGYPETLTDPSYKGQILILTYPIIGNYGVPNRMKKNGILQYFESEKIQISGLVVNYYSEFYSHFTSVQSLGSWLKKEKVPALYGVDTRALTKELRSYGTMPAKILFDPKDNHEEFIDFNQFDLVKKVATKRPIIYKKGKKKILLIDCGVKHSIIKSFLSRNVTVIRVPYDYRLSHVRTQFHGIVISNGPGDPKMCKETIIQIKQSLNKNIPILGICLGNQILALAAGGDTYKLKFGHRSQNQPCIDTQTKRCYITSQNHGYAVKNKLPRDWKVWFTNANDSTIEGIRHARKPFMSVQFHPEANPGPVDTGFIFDMFINLLK